MGTLRSLLGIARDRLTPGPLRREDRAVWAQPRTLTELGAVTALWLDGRIRSTPGYYGPVDVDEDLAPGMTDTLIALNRRGFVTVDSQAGWGTELGGEADVCGFADDAMYQRLVRLIEASPFDWYAWAPANYQGWVSKRRPQGHVPPGGCGIQRGSAREVAALFDGCSKQAIDALCSAWQIVIYDPEPGRNDLWALLRKI